MHHNEAFSAIKIEGYKNFLRLSINKDGDLTIFPIGVEKINKKWKKYVVSTIPHIEPADPGAMDKPFLIEKPIEYPKPFTPLSTREVRQGFSISEIDLEKLPHTTADAAVPLNADES
jgi:hypothetical protein